MARTAGKKQAPAKLEEDDDTEGWDDAVVEAEGKEEANLRLRDWRDVERYREMKELRRLVDDDYGLDEIFHVPLKPRGEPPVRRNGAKAAAPTGAKPQAGVRPPPKPAKAAAARAAPKKKPAPIRAKAKRK